MVLPSEKIDKILDLVKFNFYAYKKFKQILYETEYMELLKKVKDGEDNVLKEKGNYIEDRGSYMSTHVLLNLLKQVVEKR